MESYELRRRWREYHKLQRAFDAWDEAGRICPPPGLPEWLKPPQPFPRTLDRSRDYGEEWSDEEKFYVQDGVRYDRSTGVEVISEPCPRVEIPETFPEMPMELRTLTCGALTRRGTRCSRRDLWPSGRCRMHGGASTGPRRSRGRGPDGK